MIYNVLPDEFLEPGQGLFVPALGVEVEHGVGREAVGCWLLAVSLLICFLLVCLVFNCLLCNVCLLI